MTYPDGATPLDPDAVAGLIPGLTTQADLNEFEARNIAAAVRWAARSRALRRDLLTPDGLRLLHRHMFDRTWRWAGTFRRAQTNIGVDWHQIPVQLEVLCGDVRHQIAHDAFGPTDAGRDELAARFHHRLVLIHPFPNGNGRHARLAADLLLRALDRPPFPWGDTNLQDDTPLRRRYLLALRAADQGDLAPLLLFARPAAPDRI